jgi:hypothetical protein
MRHLLPITPLSDADRALLLSGSAGARSWTPVCALLADLATKTGAPALLCTTLPEIAREALDAWPGAFTAVCEPNAPPCATQREAAAWALDGCIARGLLAPDETVAVLDPRNPGLTPAVIERGAAALKGGHGLCAASLVPAHDHPAQQFTPCRLADMELFAFSDADFAWPGGDVAATRPFFFDWRGQDIWDAARAPYELVLPEDGAPARLAPCASPADALGKGATVLLREAAFTARRLLPPGLGGSVTAAPALLNASALPLTMTLTPGGGLRCLAANPSDAAGELRLWPLAGGEPGQRITPLPGPGGWLLGPDEARRLAEADGLLACLLRPAESRAGGQEYDCRVSVPCPELWTVDRRLDRPVGLDTGLPFCNRQELPDLHVLDGSLFLGRADELRRACLAPDAGWAAVELMPGEARTLRSRVDFLLAGGRDAPRESAHATADSAGKQSATPAPAEDADFSALRRELNASAWRFEQFKNLHDLHPGLAATDAFLQWVILSRHHELSRLLPDALDRREIAARRPQNTVSGGDAGLLTPLADFRLPCRPHMLTSDGARTLFVRAQPEAGLSQLLRCDLASGESRSMGRADAVYAGVWFDAHAGRLCALCTGRAGHAGAWLHFFTPGGEFQEETALPAALSEHPNTVRLHGDAHSYFVASHSCRVIYEVDKADLGLRQIHDSRAIRRMQTFCAADGGLLVTGFYSGMLTRVALPGGEETHLRGPATYFATLPDHDPVSGGTFLLVRSDFPAGGRPMRNWLYVLDRDGSELGARFLGTGSFTAVHVLARSRQALVTREDGEVLRFGLGERGSD